MGGNELDYAKLTEHIVRWLQQKVSGAGAEGCVVGVSGGIDSAVVAALCHRAFPDKTIAVVLPVHSNEEDAKDAMLVTEHLGLEARKINLDSAYDEFVSALEEDSSPFPADDLPLANIKPRLRMMALYYLAARHNCLVVGTGNKSELVTGFFTKYGDGAVDLEPIGELVKGQVVALARYLDIPEKIVERTPSAGLWPGQSDEGELGFTYQQLDEFLLTGQTDSKVEDRIRKTMAMAEHKLNMPPTCPLDEL